MKKKYLFHILTYFKNAIFISIFATGLGALFYYNNLKAFSNLWLNWTLGGLILGFAFSFMSTFLDFYILRRRIKNLNSPLFKKLKSQLSLSSHGHLLAGYYKNHLISIGWNFLPIPRIPKSGLFIFTTFKPTNSDKLYEIKKKITKTPRLLVESFYIYQFFPFLDNSEINPEFVIKAINNNLKVINKFSSSASQDKCINCKAEIENSSYKIINDIPVPICFKCETKIEK